MVLNVGERIVESNDSGFDQTKATIHAGLMGSDSIIQVYNKGIRHILKNKRANQWVTEKTIVRATSNTRQVIVAYSGGEISYFELNNRVQLSETEKLPLDFEVLSINIGPIPDGRIRSKFLAIGFNDNTVKLFSLDPDSCLQRLSNIVVPSRPESLCLAEMCVHGGGEDQLN